MHSDFFPRIGAALVAAALALAVIPARAADLEPLRVQFGTVALPAFAAPILARETGMYEKAGLKVDIMPGRLSQDTVNAIAADSADIGFVLAINLIQAVDKGQKLVAVGNMYGSNGFGVVAAKDSGITKLLDLQGKKILVPGASYESLLRALISRQGGSPDKVTYILVPQVNAMLTSYIAKQADAVLTAIPFAQAGVETNRPSIYLPFAKEGDPEPFYVWVARPDVVAKKKDQIRRFLKTTYEATGMMNANSSVAVAPFVKSVPGAQADRVVPEYALWTQFQCAEGQAVVGRASDAAWKAAVDLYRNIGLVTSAMKPTDLYTNEFFDGANTVSSVKCK
ncbi:MAG: ABC transporter substrate-binding protein [Pseudomonadota bacterium]